MITREEAHKLLNGHVKDDYQRLHSLMVANAMESYAQKFKENVDLWYVTGLLHDLDYFEFPAEHPKKEVEWFKEWGYPEGLIQAAAAHGWDRTGIQPISKLDYTLIACDELSGLLYAYSLMRPTGFTGMEAKSAIKKFNNKAFAAKVNREEIMKGVTGLQVDLKEHIAFLIETFSKMPKFSSTS